MIPDVLTRICNSNASNTKTSGLTATEQKQLLLLLQMIYRYNNWKIKSFTVLLVNNSQ